MIPHLPNGPEEQALAEILGQRVHAVWSQFALPLLGAAYATPIAWDDLDDGYKELKRRIGLSIWKDCLAAYAPAMAAAMARPASQTVQTTAAPLTKPSPAATGSDGFWRRLPDGSWGISLNYKTPLGSTVKISNKSGEIQDVVVGRLVSDANGYWVHAIGRVGEIVADEEGEPSEESTISDDGDYVEYKHKTKAKGKSKASGRLSNSEQVEHLETSGLSEFVADSDDDGCPW